MFLKPGGCCRQRFERPTSADRCWRCAHPRAPWLWRRRWQIDEYSQRVSQVGDGTGQHSPTPVARPRRKRSCLSLSLISSHFFWPVCPPSIRKSTPLTIIWSTAWIISLLLSNPVIGLRRRPHLQDPLRPLVLGGDHSISFPVVRAVSEKLGGPVDILHLDAHPDIYDAFEGNIYSHASSFARIMEGGYARRLLQVKKKEGK